MTGICGALGPGESSVASAVDTMMKAMWRRGTRVRSETVQANGNFIAVGICTNPLSPSQGFFSKGNSTIAIDGFFYEKGSTTSNLSAITGVKALARLASLPGAFSFLSAADDGLIAGRDPLGQKPLYFGASSRGNAAFASLNVGLTAIGVENSQPVPVGTVVIASESGYEAVDISHKLTEPVERDVSETDAVSMLRDLLTEAVSTGLPPKPVIAFSGGLDSALVAVMARDCDKDPELVTVGIEGQPELDHAHEVAAELGLPITIREITRDEILDSLANVVSVVESTDPVIVGVSVPFYFACRKAKEIGHNTIVAGQMSDELFGGYSRFEELVVGGMLDQARVEMWNSALAASQRDFEPGDKVAASLGLELRCPFAYLPLVKYALQLPLSLRVIISHEKATRKYILRKLAAKLKLPNHVVDRPKKAVQYSTGVQRLLQAEARRRRESLSRLLASISKVPQEPYASTPSL